MGSCASSQKGRGTLSSSKRRAEGASNEAYSPASVGNNSEPKLQEREETQEQKSDAEESEKSSEQENNDDADEERSESNASENEDRCNEESGEEEEAIEDEEDEKSDGETDKHVAEDNQSKKDQSSDKTEKECVDEKPESRQEEVNFNNEFVAGEPEEAEDIEITLKKIVNGNINVKVPSQVRLVRIFTSSTFTDTFIERNSLMERVYPKLKGYCQSVGYDFQVVDMRWGVRDEATDDHMTSELCMRELKACQDLSTGPSFITLGLHETLNSWVRRWLKKTLVIYFAPRFAPIFKMLERDYALININVNAEQTFLSQKYGYRPFPPKIYEKEFDAMLSAIEKEEDINLLEKWFIRDDNRMPAMYILQPINEIITNYNNRAVSEEERRNASNEWWKAFERMQEILRDVSEKVLVNEEEIARYKISVTEDEIRRGIFDVQEKSKHCFWFKRNITDIKESITKPKARFFIDKTSNGLDEDALSLLNTLKTKMSSMLANNTKEYDLKWHGESCIDSEDNEEHKIYIDQLCEDFYEVLIDMIDKGIEERKSTDLDDPLVKEIGLHTTTCQDKARFFYGRKDVLDAISNHVKNEDDNRVLVVHGKSGCGKTSIMAVAAKMIKEVNPEVPLILRFLGTTSESSSISKLLKSVCTQICQIQDKDITKIPETYKELMEFFEKLLRKAKKKLIIILDSLDQLSTEDGALHMKWLPKKIGENVTIILSTLPGEEYKILPVLKARLPTDAFVEVPAMPDSTAGLILNAWLRNANRKVTRDQRDVIMNAFKQCRLPLFLKLSFDEATRWKSYHPTEQCLLQDTIKESINSFFTRLERLHGYHLVSHGLGYITAAKYGLSDTELDDILSIDDDVLNDVYQYWTPPVRRIPPLLWIRVETDLGAYIVSRGVDGILVNTWYHRQFIETARERYLQPEIASKIHENLADYFLGKWSNGERKPFVSKQGDHDEKDRLMPSMPNIFPKQPEQTSDVFNYRKLNELPRHLINAGALEQLKANVLFNFDFLSVKLCAMGLKSLLQDFDEALVVYAEDMEIKLLRDCLQMSGKALLPEPNQLAAQLNARMSHFEDYKGITDLLCQSRSAHVPCLYPSITCFECPGGPLSFSLAGHHSMINWATLTKDGKKLISISEDETIKIWDMTIGEEIQSYDMDNDYSIVRCYHDDRYVVVAGSLGLFAMDLDSGDVFFKDEDITGTHGKCMDVVADGRKIVHLGKMKISVFDMNGKDIEKAWEYDEIAAKSDTGFEDLICGTGNLYAYTRGKQTELIIRKADDKEFMKKLELKYGLMHFALHGDGNDIDLVTLGSNSHFQDLDKEVYLMIWDTTTWKVKKERKTTVHPNWLTVYDMTITKSKDGLMLIWPELYEINFWNLETGEEKVAFRSGPMPDSHKQALCNDGKVLSVVAAHMNQKAIQVYDLDFIEYEEGVAKSPYEETTTTKLHYQSGERDAYLNSKADVILSLPYTEPIITFWDAKYHDRTRQITLEGSFANSVEYIDEKHLAIWDHGIHKIYILNFVDQVVKSVISGEVGGYPPRGNWQFVGDDRILAPSLADDELNLWDMKNGGKLLRTYKTESSGSIYSVLVSEDNSTAIVSFYEKGNSDARLPVVSIDLEAGDVLSTIAKEDQWIKLDREQTVLSSDGKLLYLVFWQNSIHVFDTKTGKGIKTINYRPAELQEGQRANTVFYCINSSSKAEYLVAYVICNEPVGKELEAKCRLVVFDAVTHDLLTWHGCEVYQSIQISQDGSRMLCISQVVREESKALDLWDMSKVKDGKLSLLGRFLPDSDTRFNYLTFDGSSICCGLSGVDELVFLQVCGEGERKKRKEQCVKSKIKVFQANK